MHKSVQNFLQTAGPRTYFETTFGRFIFVERIGDIGYKVLMKGVEGVWRPVAVFRITGEFQNGRQRKVGSKEMISIFGKEAAK